MFLYFHRKADISAVDKESYTPLMLAAYKGNIPAFKALLDRKANIDDIDENSKSVVHLAAEQDHAELLKVSMRSSPLYLFKPTKMELIFLMMF